MNHLCITSIPRPRNLIPHLCSVDALLVNSRIADDIESIFLLARVLKVFKLI